MIKFHSITFGCRLNQAEAAKTCATLETYGWKSVKEDEAAIILVHSCAVTEPAAHEVLRTLTRLRARHPSAQLVLSGCAATLLPTNCADLILTHDQKETWVTRILGLAPASLSSDSTSPLATHRARASLIIQDGCDRFCTYCIVPYLRGAPVSYPAHKVIEEAKELFEQGFQEIVLTGCHLALYQDGDVNLISLLKRLCALPYPGRFRLGSIEPCTMDDTALIDLIANSKGRICQFLHLPIQSGADPVLVRMQRRYTVADIRLLLDKIVTTLPQTGLGADIIVGFPGETEADFEATCQLIQDYPFTGAHLFPYSKRPGTPAASFSSMCSDGCIHKRMQTLRALVANKRHAVLTQFIGKPMVVIPERQQGSGWEGWSEQHFRCQLPATAVRKQLTPFTPTQLQGECFTH